MNYQTSESWHQRSTLPSSGPKRFLAPASASDVAHDARSAGSDPFAALLAAVANQGSNSIEGYNISTEDAIAAIQGAVEPMDSGWQDWQANLGYRRAMTYVIQLAKDEHFEYTTASCGPAIHDG